MTVNIKLVLTTTAITALLVIIVSSCAPAPKETTMEEESRETVLAYSEPIAQQVLLALNAKDYSAYSEYLDDKMRAAIPQDAFEKMAVQLATAGGEYRSHSVDRMVDYGDFVTIYYKIEYAQRNSTMNISFTKQEPYQIVGMYFQ
jgi:hypothetical protein